jgi:hypothetical protein
MSNFVRWGIFVSGCESISRAQYTIFTLHLLFGIHNSTMFRCTLFSVGLHLFIRVGVAAAADATDVVHDVRTKQHSRRLSVLEGSQINILYLKSEPVDNPDFREAISDITGGETDYFDGIRAENGAISSPTLEILSSYGCVMIHTRGSWEERDLLGDRLATYVDNGGTVVFGDGFYWGLGFTSIVGVGGAIMDVGYSPIGIVGGADELGEGHVYMGDGTTLLYENVTTFQSTVNNLDKDVTLQGDGIQDGSYSPDGTLAAAYRPDFRVVYLNGAYCWDSDFPAVDCPGDDHPRRWANACSVAFVTTSADNTPSPSTVATAAPVVTIAPVTASPTRAPETETSAPAILLPDPSTVPSTTPVPASAIHDTTSGPTDIVAPADEQNKGQTKVGKKHQKKDKVGKKRQKKNSKKDGSSAAGDTKKKNGKKRNGKKQKKGRKYNKKG